MVALRGYQQQAHDAVLAAWGIEPWAKDGGDVYRSVVANLTTSAGKTVIAGSIIASILERELGKVLFLADTDELCKQPQRTFFELFRIAADVEKAGNYASKLMALVVGSAQTFARKNRLERFAPDHFRFIFVDEAHRGSDRNKAITDYFETAKVCGMTATAFRAKLKDLSSYYEHVAFEMGLFDLIGEGYISPLKVLTLPVEVNLTEVKQTMSTDGMDYDKNELDTTIRPYYERIAEMILEHAPGRQILAFLPLIKSSQEFAQICRAKGITARHVDGQSADREMLLRDFEARRFQVLSNSSLLTTGWDCPTCDCLLNLAPTRSSGLFRQKVGRVVRLVDGAIGSLPTKEERIAAIAASAKPDALILDLLWQTERFGLVGPADLVASNQDERLAIQMKIAGLQSAEDLQELAAAVQEEREQRLKDELERARKRAAGFAGVVLDTIHMIGALLHSKKLMDYEPVMKWEELPPTDKQVAWMQKNGIDPASAKSRGHVSALMNTLFMRQKRGLCNHRVVAALEKAGCERANALQMTPMQAYTWLGHDFPFPFGKHVGKPFRAVPAGYFMWIKEQKWVRDAWPVVWAHLICMNLITDPKFSAKYDPRPAIAPAPAEDEGDAAGLFDVLP